MGNHNGCFSRRHHKNRHGSNSSPRPGKSEVPPYKSGTSDHGLPPQITDSSSSMSSLSLPYARVDSSLRALAGQAEGFGRLAIGGLQGPLYHVTTLADDGPGSLREGCRKKEPLWIVFEVSGTIGLSSYLNVSSYKTIDGRGQRMKLTGKGLRLKECEHVIICNLEFEGGRGPDVDGIQIKPKSKHIWIDRCSLSDYDDGLIDITRESTDITISRCHFSKHDKTMLIGADPSHTGDRCIRVTIHHCFFDGTRQRHPRVRFGKVHLYNNYTRNWGIYAVCASVESQVPKGWDKLYVSLLSTETGKTVSKSGKASVRNGTCRWTETLSESVWISQDEAPKELEQYLFKLVVSMCSARSSILGEATINLAGYMSSRASIPVSLPLKKCNHGTILQVEIQCLTPRTKSREEKQRHTNILYIIICDIM